jgi:NifU-like protein involved in Fe-S cluster formation
VMMARLADSKVVDQAQTIKDQIERIYKQLDLERAQIEGTAALKKLKLMTENS